MISAQMLTGIPEVDLGIDVKIQNIERTEKAKKKLLEESKLRENQREQKHLEKSSNYVQHDRWKDIQEIEMVRESQGKNQQVELADWRLIIKLNIFLFSVED